MGNNEPVKNRIRELRRLPRHGRPKGFTLAEVAAAIGTSPKQIARLENNERPLTDRWMNGLAEFFEVSVTELFTGPLSRSSTVPLVGYVGVGEMYYPDPSAGPWVGFDKVEAPPGATNMQALLVRGNALRPVYDDGDILYVTATPTECDIERCVGKDCIVHIRDGSTVVRRVEKLRGGHVRLLSVCGSSADPINNPKIEWAAPIRWVQRKA